MKQQRTPCSLSSWLYRYRSQNSWRKSWTGWKNGWWRKSLVSSGNASCSPHGRQNDAAMRRVVPWCRAGSGIFSRISAIRCWVRCVCSLKIDPQVWRRRKGDTCWLWDVDGKFTSESVSRRDPCLVWPRHYQDQQRCSYYELGPWALHDWLLVKTPSARTRKPLVAAGGFFILEILCSIDWYLKALYFNAR